MNPLRVGVLGSATIARKAVIPAMVQSDNFELIAVASRSHDRAKEFANHFNCDYEYGYDKLIARNDLDMIYVPIPNSLHIEWGYKVLESNRHLLMEKPCCTDYSSTEKLISLARKKRLLVMENFQFVYHRQFKFIEDLLAQKVIGEIRNLRATFGYPPLEGNDFRYDQNLGGGAVLDAGCYTVKISSLLLGDELSVDTSKITYDKDKGIDIYGSATVSNSLGITGQLAWGMDNYYQCQLEVWGSEGKLTANRIFTAHPHIEPEIVVERQDGRKAHQISTDNHFSNLLQEFYHSIKEQQYDHHLDSILVQSKTLQEVIDKSI